MYSIDDYDYHLPEHLIAQTPSIRRDRSRLLVVDRTTGGRVHERFGGIVDRLEAGDVLVVNNTKVIPARLHGTKATGGKVEVLVLGFPDPDASGDLPQVCRCLIRASKSSRPGTRLGFDHGFAAEVVDAVGDGIYRVRFFGHGSFWEMLEQIGKMPLPPYINRSPDTEAGCDDRQSYQTVYASRKGAVAAPTAGLHFTLPLLDSLRAKGVSAVEITLHVGYGTFLPVRVTDIRKHRMHTETFDIEAGAAEAINRAKAEGRRVVAVGTTAVRTLEYAAGQGGRIIAGRGACDLFIYPGFRFNMVDAMVTNFHLPRSTLLMLVSAFAGRDRILAAYAEAVARQYRFFSYGDAMMIV
ncbi:MAG: tRNA preQ1(34) S-adenosylmethionine ribosyltransferase-isomerase QueA [Desulfobacterales bacterium]|nr:tRNA preQ1(34) S-adenosylmethionine ribosyltransferase-isomerase QueA [Desulfobacterales bacterium]